jgi:hypothetical protein
MTVAVLEHPLVRDYLRRLHAACAALPAAQARELRDQIIAHLDEALPADAADVEVGAELDRLGPGRARRRGGRPRTALARCPAAEPAGAVAALPRRSASRPGPPLGIPAGPLRGG